ncbi:MAG TPA: carboxypeptidase-like regulatory domain-containing protein [Vicinamibacterales bacterium]|nr:carboxypeptidase-like regulatory domain-containing protein [Vicinamibacterales bacterium]
MRSSVGVVACAAGAAIALLAVPSTVLGQARPPAGGGQTIAGNRVPGAAAPRPASPVSDAATSGTSRTPAAARPVTPVRGGASGNASAAAGSRTTSIQGAAWRSDNTPVPRATLRLRNMATGKVEATTVASDTGNFVFNAVPDGTYVIEMVTQSGKVVMVGQSFTVAPGETVATFVRMGPRVPWFNGFFGNAAQTVSSSAASTGVTAVAPERIPPVSSVR